MSDTSTRLTEFLEKYDESTDTSNLDMYRDLTPLYDAFYVEHYDYDSQAEIIEEYTDLAEDSVIVEGACGTGRLLDKLDEKYTAFGFDISPEMLDIASENTDASLFRSRLEDFFVPYDVDCVFIFGNAIYHISPDDRQTLFEQAYRNMSNQSTFIFTFMDANDYEDGHSDGDVYTVGDWKLRRNGISVRETTDEVTTTFSYRISEVDSDYTRLQVGVSIEGYVHHPQKIESELHNIGFTNITIMKPDDVPHTVAIARKVS